VRKADQQQANTKHDAKARVDDELHEQVAADALAGVSHRLGCHGHLAAADQTD